MKTMKMRVARLVMAVLFCTLFAGCAKANDPYFEDICKRLYDASWEMVSCTMDYRGSYWDAISPETQAALLESEKPSLELLLKAMWEMDHAKGICLADGFDEVLYEYDAALEEYNEYLQKHGK